MGYFRELPDLEYQSPLQHKNSSLEYVRIKNFFRRVVLREDLKDRFVLFDKYQIPDGSRPDTVAEEFYGKADYDWIVLLTAGITNVRDQWPLSDRDLYRFVVTKYGDEDINNVHHYETTEVKDSAGRLILPTGQVVDSNFTIPDPDNKNNVDLNPVVGVSNFEYEVFKNNEKRSIYLLKSSYLQQYLNDMRSIMHYDQGSQYVNKKLIRTENTRLIGP
jgi:hypothetical protein